MPRHETLEQWLAWFETLHPKQIDLGLDRIHAVLAALSLSAPPYRVVTVGGTNGKGSCVALLESIYARAGYKVGAFTSPHLWRFNERIRIDGRDVSDATLVDLFGRIDAALGSVTLSYFEASAVAAMLGFADHAVDVAILEVGMGGRLDAVNAYDADAALIVSVDLDHQAYLGPDRDAIGFEKAGIMRRGKPVVVADPDPPARLVAHAESIGARLIRVGRDYHFTPTANGIELRFGDAAAIELPKPRFGGVVQRANTAASAAVVEALEPVLPVMPDALTAGIEATELNGRLERRERGSVEWLFDVAHNPAAARAFERALAELPHAERTGAVFAAMADKDLAGVLGGFVGQVDRWFVGPVDSPRTATADALLELLDALGARDAAAYADPAAATRAAEAWARPGDRVIVFGSFYTVGPAMAALGLYLSTGSMR